MHFALKSEISTVFISRKEHSPKTRSTDDFHGAVNIGLQAETHLQNASKQWTAWKDLAQSAVRSEIQERDCYRFWAAVDELEGRFLTLSDKLTIHNAFLDRRFRP